MRLIIAILVIVLLGSCASQKRCAIKFPVTPEIVRHDSIVYKDTIIYHDRVIHDTIYPDTVFSEGKVRIIKDAPISEVVRAENEYAVAKAWVENKKLKLQLEQKGQVIDRIIENAEKETIHWKEEYHSLKETKVTVEKYIPKIYKASLWILIIIVILTVGFIYLKIKTNVLKSFIK